MINVHRDIGESGSKGEHLGIGNSFELASWAETKSIAGSRRRHPVAAALVFADDGGTA
jgi:hypothetical protein